MPPTANRPEPTRMPIPGSGTVVASSLSLSLSFFHHPFPHCFDPSPQPAAFSPLLLQPCSLASARAIAGTSSVTPRNAASRRFFMVTPVGNTAKSKTAQSLSSTAAFWGPLVLPGVIALESSFGSIEIGPRGHGLPKGCTFPPKIFLCNE
jgi:hypothetical protein